MQRAFGLLDQLPNVVEGKPRLQITKVPHRYLELLTRSTGTPARQPEPQHLIHNFSERPVSPVDLRLELGRHIVIQGKRSTHHLDAMSQAS